MKTSLAALVFSCAFLPLLAAAVDGDAAPGRTNLTGTISAVQTDAPHHQMIPALRLDQPLSVAGPKGSVKQQTWVTLTKARVPSVPKRPLLGDVSDPLFTNWSG